ncbi:hypothetical protein [Polyangium aurulentum]|uniref:hypothetical protein n=1 Tax=Polyangium aurulentum TaxID=2567896 RepID=UPI0010AE075D|nr:hypothetical protein [Polyangium aurulentum]UQA59176.1 hypothetical protein E8A73_001260 [Polyangium aurulentum]
MRPAEPAQTVPSGSPGPGGRIYTVRGFRDGLYGEAEATWVVSDPDLLAAFVPDGAALGAPGHLQRERVQCIVP